MSSDGLSGGKAEKGSIITHRQFPAAGLEDSPEASDELTDPASEAHGTTREPDPVALTVIIPVRNDPTNLELCLQALATSQYGHYEVIVVDDGSTDTTPEVARRHDVRLIQLPERSGPAAARNRGAQDASHPHLFFLDADVCVQPETLGQVAARFQASPATDAFFGSYDTRPGAPNFLSQYRNLLHHFVHQDGKTKAFSFWSGCGAIRRSVFLELGGFDTGYSNASIEDIELGSRLREAGHQVELVKEIQVKHMKRWTFGYMVLTDIRNRAIPWTRLVLRQGKIPNDLNLKYSQRLSALLAAGLVASLAIGSWFDPIMLLIPVLALLLPILIDRWTAQQPLPVWARIVGGLAIIAGSVATASYIAAGHVMFSLWSLVASGFLLGIVLLNLGFYLFLFRVKHPLFVLLTMPLHVLYYLYSSAAFGVGVILHMRAQSRAESS